MGDISVSGRSVFRDYVTDSVPSSGKHNPFKSEIRDLIDAIDSHLPPLVSLQSLDAAGNGDDDDTDAVLAAAARNDIRLTGLGGRFLVSDDIDLPNDDAWLEDAEFIRAAGTHGSATRIIKASSGATGNFVFRRLKINRNGAPGDTQTLSGGAAGLYISGDSSNPTLKLHLEDVEVYGDGAGYGIYYTDFDTAHLIRPHVRDMAWHATGDPGTEQLIGVGFTRYNRVYIENPQIHRLMGWYGSNKLRAYQSDGLGFGAGRVGATVVGGTISFVGEGHDSSGSDGAYNVWFYGTSFEDIGSHGFKPATLRNSGLVGGRLIRCGLDGITGGTNSGLTTGNISQNVVYDNVLIIDPGANHDWGGGFGVFLDSDGLGPDPSNQQFSDINIVANGAAATGSIAGKTLTVSAVASGAVVQGQFVAGSGVTGGTYIVETGEAASIIGSISGTTLTVSSTHYGTIVAGQTIYGPGITTGTTIVSGSGPYVISNAHSLTSVAMLLKKETAGKYTVSASQTVASTALTMTSNMTYGVRIESGMEDVASWSNINISGEVTAKWSGSPTRVAHWRGDKKLSVIGGLIVPSALTGDTRSVSALSTGFESRYDDNGDHIGFTFKNYGIAGAAQGTSVAFDFGAAAARIDYAALLDILSIADWASGGNQTAKARLRLANGSGTLVDALFASPTGVLVPRGTLQYYGAAGGTADALTLTPAEALTSYVTDQAFYFKATANNATTTPTMAISGLASPRTLVKRASTALAAGDLVNGAYYQAVIQASTITILNPTVP